MARHSSNANTGRLGERVARDFLIERGYVIVEQNWRCQAGEIDIVAHEGGDWVFVEVKARHGASYGLPEEAVTPTKRQRLLRCGLSYIESHSLGEASWRIDVVAILLSKADRSQSLHLYQNAVYDNGQL